MHCRTSDRSTTYKVSFVSIFDILSQNAHSKILLLLVQLKEINTEDKKLYDDKGNELADISSSFTPQKLEFIKAGGSYAIVFGKKLQGFACDMLGIELKSVYAPSKIISHEGQGLTAVEKIFNANAVGVTEGKVLHAGSDVRVKVNIVGSQDTTGLMTSQEFLTFIHDL